MKIEADWLPRVPGGSRILVAGASGGIGSALVRMIGEGREDAVIGAHGRRAEALPTGAGIVPLVAQLSNETDCRRLVDDFCDAAGGIDGIVILIGGTARPAPWPDMEADAWEADLSSNLSLPFYLARAAFLRMCDAGKGGRIILTGTESALHGGGRSTLAYGVAKCGTECLVQGMAREGAPHGILVNGVRMGFIASGAHERWHKLDPARIAERVNMVPLKRAGTTDEVAALVTYLLSDWAGFITGQMIPITGGDWL